MKPLTDEFCVLIINTLQFNTFSEIWSSDQISLYVSVLVDMHSGENVNVDHLFNSLHFTQVGGGWWSAA